MAKKVITTNLVPITPYIPQKDNRIYVYRRRNILQFWNVPYKYKTDLIMIKILKLCR